MVAFAGADPIGVLIGAKRPSGTLIHKIAVHPDHQRQGHGRHLLTSLSSKLAILGPPRIVAEVPETLAPACELFGASGYAEETILTDYVLNGARIEAGDLPGRYMIPITLDDLAANGLLGDAAPRVCWERSIETINARKDDVFGLAVASDERIEASVLYIKDGEILSLRTFVDDGGACLKPMLARLRANATTTFSLPKVHPAEVRKDVLEALGFRPGGSYRLYARRARPD